MVRAAFDAQVVLAIKAGEITRLDKDLTDLKRMIEADARLLQDSDGSSLAARRTEYQEAQQQNEQLNSKLANLHRNASVAQAQIKEAQAKLNSLVDRTMEEQRKQAELDRGKQEKVELSSKNVLLREEVESLKGKVKATLDDIVVKETERKKMRVTKQQEEAELKKIADTVERELMEIKSIANACEQFAAGDKHRAGVRTEMKLLDSELHAAKDRFAVLDAEIRSASEGTAATEQQYRNICDNLDLRKRAKDLVDKNNELKTLRAKMGALGDLAVLSRQVDASDKQRSTLQSKKDALRGAISADEQRATEIDRELKQDKFRNVDQEHRKKNIAFETTRMANMDLEKFYKALDKALMEFHSMKMTEINGVLRDLWRLTYKGTDIDEVIIKSDINEDSAEVSAAGRKQYNYRVVMKQGDTELDMRVRPRPFAFLPAVCRWRSSSR
jgi:DNA repair protein RAD50